MGTRPRTVKRLPSFEKALEEHLVAPVAPPTPVPAPSTELSPVQANVSSGMQRESSLRTINRENRFDPVSCLLTTIMIADLGLLGAFLLFASPLSLSGARPLITTDQMRNFLVIGIILVVSGWGIARARAVPRPRRRARNSPYNRGG